MKFAVTLVISMKMNITAKTTAKMKTIGTTHAITTTKLVTTVLITEDAVYVTTFYAGNKKGSQWLPHT